jgi:hypothetical protein
VSVPEGPTREEFNFLREELRQLRERLERLEQSTSDAVLAHVRYGGCDGE